jgi:hypothetical protein
MEVGVYMQLSVRRATNPVLGDEGAKAPAEGALTTVFTYRRTFYLGATHAMTWHHLWALEEGCQIGIHVT